MDNAAIAAQNSISPTDEGKWIPSILLGLLLFIFWQPPGLRPVVEFVHWYVLLAWAFLIFLFQGPSLNLSGSRVYLTVSGLSLTGAYLALVRTPNFGEAIWQTIGATVNLFTGFLLLPTLATIRGRKMFLRSLFLAACMWAVYTVILWRQMGTAIRFELTGRGQDHNFLGLTMALAATMLISLFINTWQSEKKTLIIIIKRLFFFFGVLGFSFAIIISFSRSSLVTLVAGFLAVAGLTIWAKRQFWVGLGVVLLLAVAAAVFFPTFAKDNPIWATKMDELRDPTAEYGTSMGGRVRLTRKALGIIADNPFIGVGKNVFRESLDEEQAKRSFSRRQTQIAHNAYLGDWAELGILGIISHLLFWIYWLKEVFRVPLASRPVTDQVLLMIFPPFFVMKFFLDTSGWSMLLALSGLYYERAISRPEERGRQPVA